MTCKQLLNLWKVYDTVEFEYCPNCGVHAPWVNDCKEEEE